MSEKVKNTRLVLKFSINNKKLLEITNTNKICSLKFPQKYYKKANINNNAVFDCQKYM